MQFTATYDLPEQVAVTLRHHWNTLAKNQFGRLAVIGYTMGILTSYQIQQMPATMPHGGTLNNFYGDNQCYLHYNAADFQHDGEVFQDVVGKSPQT